MGVSPVIEVASLVMHTYLLRIGLMGQNSIETVERVRKVLKRSMRTDFQNNNRTLKQRMDPELVDIFGSENHYYLWVDAMWRSAAPEKKSFFVNIMVRDKKHIIITAEYREINSLREMSAMIVARFVDNEKDVEKLEVPKSLFPCIKEFF